MALASEVLLKIPIFAGSISGLDLYPQNWKNWEKMNLTYPTSMHWCGSWIRPALFLLSSGHWQPPLSPPGDRKPKTGNCGPNQCRIYIMLGQGSSACISQAQFKIQISAGFISCLDWWLWRVRCCSSSKSMQGLYLARNYGPKTRTTWKHAPNLPRTHT